MPVVLISRGTMSGVKLLVECLRDQEGFRCVSREDLVALVNKHGELANRIVENLRTATRAYEQFSQLRRPYTILMRLALLEYASGDNLVYHGYSGHLLLPSIRHFIRVRINAPLKLRVKMTMERLACTEPEAKDYIVQEDERRLSWARFMYGRDVRDLTLYDVGVNLDRMSMKAVCGLVQRLAEDPEFKATPESSAQVERLLVAARVEAELATDPRTMAMEIGAAVKPDKLELTGPYVEDHELEAVLGIAKAASGLDRVEYTPGYAPTLGFGS